MKKLIVNARGESAANLAVALRAVAAMVECGDVSGAGTADGGRWSYLIQDIVGRKKQPAVHRRAAR